MSDYTLYEVATWPTAKAALLAERDLRLRVEGAEVAAEIEREIALIEAQQLPANTLFEMAEYFSSSIRADWLRHDSNKHRAVVVRYVCAIDRIVRVSEADVYHYQNKLYVYSNAA